jgi:ribosomal protein S18 acetylase RimI-like enzyme
MDFSLRPILLSDIGCIHGLQRRIEEQDRIPITTSREEFEDWLHEPHFDLATHSRLAEAGGEVVAWGRIWHQPSEVREVRAYLRGAVDPAHRGMGIGSALLKWQIERASEILKCGPSHLPRFVRVHAFDFEHSAHRLFERHGLTPIRYSEVMLRDLDSLPAPSLAEGIDIVRWDPALSERARLAQNDAFADHWGSTPRDRAGWEHVLAVFGTRLDLSYLALEGDRVVGVCRNGHYPDDEAVSGRRDGWILQVSVIRSHRKRGIASALIATSLGAFKAAGLTHSALGVDSENTTGAYQLYERLGYRSMHRAVVRQLTV